MAPIAIVWLTALACGLLLTPLVRYVAIAYSAVDRPDGRRKLQAKAVALGGGVAVFCAFCVALGIACWLSPPNFAMSQLVVGLLASGLALGITGLVDDLYGMRARTKLGLQLLGVLPLAVCGVFPHDVTILAVNFHLGSMTIPLAALWLLACVNAVNFLDGLDGFAATVSAALVAGVAVLAHTNGHVFVVLISTAFLGAICGFLPYNRPPASIYLGDTGSMLLGLVLGSLSLLAPERPPHGLPVLLPIAIMVVPLWDTMAAILRRWLSGQPVSTPDRGHLHHRLVERGLPRTSILGLIACVCLCTSGIAVGASTTANDTVAVAGMIGVVVVMATARMFGHHELATLCRVIAERLVPTQSPTAHPKSAGGLTLDPELAGQLDRVAAEFGLAAIRLAYHDATCMRMAVHPGRAMGNRSTTLEVRVVTHPGATCDVEVDILEAVSPQRLEELARACIRLANEWAARQERGEPDTIAFPSLPGPEAHRRGKAA